MTLQLNVRAVILDRLLRGPRLMEGACLQVQHIDDGREMLQLPGKGGKERCIPLPSAVLQLLRGHWRSHHNPVWLFPSSVRTTQI